MEYIVQLAMAVKLYQQKTEVVPGVGVLNTSCEIAKKTLANLHGKWIQTSKRRQQRREASPFRSQLFLSEHPQKRLPKHKDLWKTPFLNLDPLTCCSGPKNIALVRNNGWALLKNGSTINAVTQSLLRLNPWMSVHWVTWLLAWWV